MLCPREKIFHFHHILRKLWTFEKNQQAIFRELLRDGFFFLHPLCFRLKWVKSGEKRNFFNKISFSSFWHMLIVNVLLQIGNIINAVHIWNAKKLYFYSIFQNLGFSLPSYTKSYLPSPTIDLILDRQNHRFCDFCLIISRELMCLASSWESSE